MSHRLDRHHPERRRSALGRLTAGAAVAGALFLSFSTPASTQAPPPAPQAFLTLASGYSQALVGVADVGVFDEDPSVAKVLGGVAFAPDGDVWVADCVFQHTKLRRIDMQTPRTPVLSSTPSLNAISAPMQVEGGCGLVNHPDGAMYSNSTSGLYKLDASTGAVLAGPLGNPGNALGIAVDPVSRHLIYPAPDCHDRLVSSPATCTLWDFDPIAGTTQPFAMFPHADVPFVDGLYFDPSGDYLFVTNRVDIGPIVTAAGEVAINHLTIVSRPTAPVTAPGTAQIVQHVPMTSEPDGVAFHAVDKFVVTNDESNGTMTRFDFPGGDYAQPPSGATTLVELDGLGDPTGITYTVYGQTFASGGHRGDLTQVGPDGCIYATQGRHFVATDFGTRFDDGTETGDDSVVRICAGGGGGFVPPPGVNPDNAVGSIAGSVYLDTNGNHAIDATDTFLPGVTVTLSGTASSTAGSSAGPAPAYAFTALAAGAYSVSVPAVHGGYQLSASTPGTVAATITPAGENITGIDFLYEAGRLTGSVYLDANDTGAIDAGDSFLSGVSLALSGPSAATTVSSSGPSPAYSFLALPGGTYTVNAPAAFGGYLLTTANPASRTLAPGGLEASVDFLYVRGRLSGYAYVDANGNGARDPGEAPLAGVLVTAAGLGTTTTAADGSYGFRGLAEGDVVVSASSPASGYALSTTSPLTVHVPAGGNVPDNNFGYRPGTLSGFAYVDANGNHVMDATESGLPGAVIVLGGGGSAVTSGTGGYAFTGLPASTYMLGAPSAVGAYVLTSSPTLTASLPAGGSVPNLNFGYQLPPPPVGSIAGVAYVDANNNGAYDSGETILSGVTITLAGTAGATAATTGTGYAFGNLLAGPYTVSAPASVPGYSLSTTSPLGVSLAPGEHRTNVNFGYRPAIAFVTYTQGGWGAPPNGNNPGMLLQNNFNAVYATCPSKTAAPATTANTCVTIGIVGEASRYFLRFTSSTAIRNFLPAGGAPKSLKSPSANNPTSSAAGVFAGQVLAVQLAVNFSNAGVITPGLASLKVAAGNPMAGQTVAQVLAIANRVLGGDTSALPAGMSTSGLNDVMTRINENFDNGTSNNGFLVQ